MNRYYMQEQFDQWFNELEGYSFRSERLIDDLYYAADTKDVSTIITWIKAAFEEGYKAAKEEQNEKES
ncbi:MAG: hypothetical protein ACO3CQ_02725 [Candidatus Nanopelagicaceae bacterium]